MNWNQRFGCERQPTAVEISEYIACSLWDTLCRQVEQTYGVQAVTEHSRCSGAPGWNVKYKKGGRSLCTLYPAQGYFTCLVALGGEGAVEAELALDTFSPSTRDLFHATTPFQGSRWLMVRVTTAEILSDVMRLIALRAKTRRA